MAKREVSRKNSGFSFSLDIKVVLSAKSTISNTSNSENP
jgi:hypothetical protein